MRGDFDEDEYEEDSVCECCGMALGSSEGRYTDDEVFLCRPCYASVPMTMKTWYEKTQAERESDRQRHLDAVAAMERNGPKYCRSNEGHACSSWCGWCGRCCDCQAGTPDPVTATQREGETMAVEFDAATERQVEVMRHALGLNERGRGTMYRNHFVAGGDDETICRQLVGLGLMVEGRKSDLTGGDPIFHVTESGKKIASAQR